MNACAGKPRFNTSLTSSNGLLGIIVRFYRRRCARQSNLDNERLSQFKCRMVYCRDTYIVATWVQIVLFFSGFYYSEMYARDLFEGVSLLRIYIMDACLNSALKGAEVCRFSSDAHSESKECVIKRNNDRDDATKQPIPLRSFHIETKIIQDV